MRSSRQSRDKQIPDRWQVRLKVGPARSSRGRSTQSADQAPYFHDWTRKIRLMDTPII